MLPPAAAHAFSDYPRAYVRDRNKPFAKTCARICIFLICLFLASSASGCVGFAEQQNPGLGTVHIAIFILFAAIIVESCLVLACLMEARRRNTSGQALKELSGRLINAAEEERRRIARELHDDIGQRLSLLAMSLDLLKNEPASSAGGLQQRLQEPLEEIKELATDVHQLSHRLHSSKLQHLGLRAALKEVCRQISNQHHVDINLQAGELASLPEDISLCFYRVAQEALNNVVKHSRSRRVDVQLSSDEEKVRLLVKDFGVGFDPEAPAHGLGLATMQERLRMVRGTLSIKSISGAGTELTAEAKAQRAHRATHAA